MDNREILIIDSQFTGWRREYYHVPEINDETIKEALDGDYEPFDSEYLYDTFRDTGFHVILNDDYVFIKLLIDE